MSRLGARHNGAALQPFSVRLNFKGNLTFFLKRSARAPVIERALKEKTSVKDVIESCGVPHTEVDIIIVEGAPVNFSFILHKNTSIDVYPVDFTNEIYCEHRLQRSAVTTFVTDGHLGKLTRNLRLLGLNVVSPALADDRQLLDIMQRENRALLTRDRRLLMHAVVRDGFYPRSQDANEQTIEVIRRFKLLSVMAPFSRCLRCNGLLAEVGKAAVLESLEPLTRIYYERFCRCSNCGQIYWPGTHFDKLRARIEEFRAKLP